MNNNETIPTFGKRLKIGDTFLHQSKRLCKGNRGWNTPAYKRYQNGDKDYFQKGKRKYYCEIVFLQETKVGWNVTTFDNRGPRYWQFTYLVKVIEN